MTMLHEPVHSTWFPLSQFFQGVEVAEEYIPSQSTTLSVSVPAALYHGRLMCLPHELPYCRRRSQVGEFVGGGGVKN